MADTREPELTAEMRLASELTPMGILVAKPYFDQMGADLLGFIASDPKGFICRIQSKFRDCSRRSQVELPAEYIEKAFLLYLHMVVGGQLHQAFLLPQEIRERFTSAKVRGKNILRITLTPKKATDLGGDPDLALTPKKVTAIMSLMRSSSALANMFNESMKIFARANRAIELSNKAKRLQELVHKAQIAKMQKEAADSHLATLQEYLALAESQLTPEQRKELGSTSDVQRRTVHPQRGVDHID
jgi:hypothetical protein